VAHALLPIAGKGSSDWGYAPIPVIGPLAGGALAGWLLRFLAVS
jgi:glycerol uptake facilitator protein